MKPQDKPYARTVRLGISWEAELRFEEIEIICQNRRYILTTAEDRPGIRIIDVSRESGADEARKSLSVAQVPTIILAPEDMRDLWLADVSLEHDICPADATDRELALRAIRIFRRHRNFHRLMKRSLVDPLTGLLNRSEFHRRMDIEFEMAVRDRPLALLMADLDDFREINDVHGYLAGDRILKEFADFLKASVGDASAVYRYGGDEFAILVKMNDTQSLALGEFIRNEIYGKGKNLESESGAIPFTVSIGTATSEGCSDVQGFIERSTTALYQAKAGGRNRVVDYQAFSEEARDDGSDPDIRDFENQIRVLTERLTRTLTTRSLKLYTSVREQADVDGLTGLFNRRYFDKRMTREFESAGEYDRPLSLIFIDIDHFGIVNKTRGFTVGDQALREVTGNIVDSVRPTDWVARYGGEEICVILPDTLEDEASRIAERIRSRVEVHKIRDFEGRDFSVTVSAGVAQKEAQDSSLKAFVQRTGNRTRCAKESGRNKIWDSDCDRAEKPTTTPQGGGLREAPP